MMKRSTAAGRATRKGSSRRRSQRRRELRKQGIEDIGLLYTVEEERTSSRREGRKRPSAGRKMRISDKRRADGQRSGDRVEGNVSAEHPDDRESRAFGLSRRGRIGDREVAGRFGRRPPHEIPQRRILRRDDRQHRHDRRRHCIERDPAKSRSRPRDPAHDRNANQSKKH